MPLHADAASMAPDGVRIAYVQSDGPMVRIVVVNLDEPSRTLYFNLGETFTDPVSIFWNTSRDVELRTGSKSYARFAVDPQRTGETYNADGPLLPVLNEAAIIAELRHKLPHRSVEILNWDNGKRRVLILAETNGKRGRYFVYDRACDLLFEVSYRKPKASDT